MRSKATRTRFQKPVSEIRGYIRIEASSGILSGLSLLCIAADSRDRDLPKLSDIKLSVTEEHCSCCESRVITQLAEKSREH